MFYRDTWCEIDLDAFRANVKLVQKISGKELFAVVKANGYGLGDFQLVRAAEKCGVRTFAVSSLDEAIALRLQGITSEILVLGVSRCENVLAALKHDIILSVPSLKWAKGVAEQQVEGLRFHIKVDTGMHRLGVKSSAEVVEILQLLGKKQRIEGIFSHYANADEKDHQVNDRQFAKFRQIVEEVDYPFKWIHISNSEATLGYQEDFSNAVRCGIALLGVSAYQSELKPVASVYAKIVHTQTLEAGSPLSYSGVYTTGAREYIATLPIGYADGFMRCNEGGRVYLAEEYGFIVGRICMDQLLIRMDSHHPETTVVELLGNHISINEVAERCKTIPYEILTALSDRVVRVYREEHRIVHITNDIIDKNLT